MVSVYPARWCTSPLGVVPAGLGDGVGDCHDVTNLPRVRFLISLWYVFLGEAFPLFLRVWFLIFVYCWVMKSLRGSPPHATVMRFR